MRASPVDPVWRMKMAEIAVDLGLGRDQWMRVHVVFVHRLNFVPKRREAMEVHTRPERLPVAREWAEDRTVHVLGSPGLGRSLAEFWVGCARAIWWRSV